MSPINAESLSGIFTYDAKSLVPRGVLGFILFLQILIFEFLAKFPH
jgi:hypothetical protein